MKNASLKRDRLQAKIILIGFLISLFSLTSLLIVNNSYWLELIPFVGLLVLISVCNHYANQYNNFSFNAANLAKYVYTAVKMPVLILDDAGDIMLCNIVSESFFKKNSEQLTKLKLYDLFDFTDNNNAVCRVEGQKCQVSLNYVYDKFNEIICTVVIVTDITEKEDLIRQLNESHAQIESFNKELQSEVDRQTESIRNLQAAIVYSMSDLIEKKDGYTGVHTRRVSEYVSILLRELVRRGHNFSESDIKRIAESSLLHDMGKIAIPDNILLKNGKLTDDEFNVMKSHSAKGADSLEKSMQFAKDDDFLKNAFVMAKHHHEKWNGGGYPDGKKENEIPLLARVIAIADVYDALRSERSYKAPFSREKAKSIILEERGHQFDPELVEFFLAVESQFDEFCESSR
jgi:Response regulator containing a CheY-like receiver domain and an HD-GYP domain